MNKLVKRTLAFLLVVCMLFGTMAMSAFATEEIAGSIVYDFTKVANTDNEQDENDVRWGEGFYGFGNSNANVTDWPIAKEAMAAFYDTGKYTWTDGEGNEQTTEFDMNWNFLSMGLKDAQATDSSSVIFGGYHYDNTKKATYFNGIEFTPKYTYSDGDTNKVLKCSQGWIAIKIKAPAVGTYTVSLDYTKSPYGANACSFYLVPGVVSDEDAIRDVINRGIGKLEGSFNLEETSTNIKKDEEAIYAQDIDDTGANTATNVGLPVTGGNLGTVSITKAQTEYTLIVTADKNRNGDTTDSTSAHTPAQIALDRLTLTPTDLAEDYNNGRVSATYDMRRPTGSALVTAVNAVKDKAWDNGTGTALTSTTNAYLKYNFDASADGYEYNAPLQDKLTELYNNGTHKWQILGRNADKYIRFLADYAVIETMTSGYLAIKIKAPGEGKYTVDLSTAVQEAAGEAGSTSENVTHLWLDAKIQKLEAGMSADNYADYYAAAEAIGSYKPAYGSYTKGTEVTNDANFAMTYEFEGNADYILYLSKNADADTTKNTANGNYMPTTGYLKTLIFTPVAPTVATIGDTYQNVSYTMGMDGSALYSYMNSLAVAGDKYTDGSATGTTGEGDEAVTTGALITNDGNGKGAMWQYHADFGAASGKTDNIYMVNKQQALYDSGANNWAPLGYTEGDGTISYDNTQLKADSMAVGKAFAIKLASPGNGEYTLNFGLRAMTKTDYNTTHCWMNVYVVKADEAILADYAGAFEAVKQNTPAGELKSDYTFTSSSTSDERNFALDLVAKGTSNNLTVDFEQDAEYIVYFELHEDADVTADEADTNYSVATLYLRNITANITGDADTEINTYNTFAAALAAATAATDPAGKVIKLRHDVYADELVLPAGVTVDLNGYALSADSFATGNGAVNGTIVDSKYGDGLLNVFDRDVTFTGSNALAANTLPLYDAANCGVRFYGYTNNCASENIRVTDDENGTSSVKFWFQIEFISDDAYALIKTRQSGIKFGVQLDVNGANKDNFNFAKRLTNPAIENDADHWAAAYADFAEDANNPWLYVTVLNVTTQDVTIRPTISAIGCVDTVLTAMDHIND